LIRNAATGKGTQTSLSEINMIPFIDVVLVLLIIFMFRTSDPAVGIEVDAPKTKINQQDQHHVDERDHVDLRQRRLRSFAQLRHFESTLPKSRQGPV